MSGDDELRRFGRDLGKIAGTAIPKVDAVLKRGAQNIKTGLQDNLAQSEHFRSAAASISYDRVGRFGSLEYVVGPDKDRFAGPLANIAFFGTSRGGGTVDFDGPFREELPNVEKYLGDVLDDLGGTL